MRIFRELHGSRRRGALPIEVAGSIAVFFVAAMLFYLVAVRSFAGLYQIVAIHTSAPYL